MVRRLKSDLRRIDPRSFPKRSVDPIVLDGLPETAAELRLPKMLAAYGELRAKRIARLPPRHAANAKLTFVGLQQRLLSSIGAFLRTLEVHRKSLLALIEKEEASAPIEAAQAFVTANFDLDEIPMDAEEETAEATIAADEDAAADAASRLGGIGAQVSELRTELAAVDEMLQLAKQHAARPDSRVAWLVDWIRSNMVPSGRWNDRRVILFTEWEDTRRWLQRRLLEALEDTDRVDERIDVFTGATGTDRREAVKLAFNADPATEPLRILIFTDAAREGINLQTRCHDRSTSICRGTRRGSNSATAVLTANCSQLLRSSAAILSTRSARRTSSWRRSSARPKRSERSSARRAKSFSSGSPIGSTQPASNAATRPRGPARRSDRCRDRHGAAGACPRRDGRRGTRAP
ncbi:MAG TPA: hypothetical protein VNZ53_19665 [Steroidobacteraceae bacterium]|nr:hypothetical protein [Steroidobacteraceae bacterium]